MKGNKDEIRKEEWVLGLTIKLKFKCLIIKEQRILIE